MSVSQIINVIVNSKGVVTVQKQLNSVGDSARSTTTYLNGLRAVLSSVLAFSGAQAIVQVADQFVNLQNKLRIVSDETNTVGESWQRLMQIANSSYSTIDSTVDLYFRVAQAYKAWGESAEKAYQFTDLFQKAAILSGSSMQTTSQAVYQFGQALNKGKLDGDEFRSVLEGLPYVANILQKSLGVTRAELYKMSAQGLISIDKVKEAFESAADTIRGDFTNITPTIGMAMNVLRSNWIDFIGEIQTSTGVFSGVAQLILLVANHFDLLAAALTPVIASLAFLAGRAGLGLVVIGLKDMYAAIKLVLPVLVSLNAVLWANPYVLAAAAIAAVVAAVIYFRNELGLTNEVLSNLWTVAVQVFTYIFVTLNPIVALANTVVQLFGGWLVVWQNIKSAAAAVGQTIVAMFKMAVSSVASLVAYLGKALGPVFTDLMTLAQNFYDLVMDIVDLFLEAWAPAFQEIGRVFKIVWDFIKPALVALIGFISDVASGWKIIGGYLQGNFWPIIKDVFDGWVILIRDVIKFINDMISALRTAINLAKQLLTLGFGGGGNGVGAHSGFQGYAGEFAGGGSFKVGGTNSGRDQTPVSFRAERGERVTVETKKQQRANDNAANQNVSVNVPLQVVNVMDPKMVPAANETVDGQRSILNAIKANRDEVAAVLGVY